MILYNLMPMIKLHIKKLLVLKKILIKGKHLKLKRNLKVEKIISSKKPDQVNFSARSFEPIAYKKGQAPAEEDENTPQREWTKYFPMDKKMTKN
ncbi:hypothetical protein Avbf_17825 [Armadillidium vulgare]|nr:hypothetical protein Avbf_17825 [Armadillidium vulgare]